MAKKNKNGQRLSELHQELKELPDDPKDMESYMKRLRIEQAIRGIGKRPKNRFFVSEW
ncbi:hypothetical protein [Priestia aryabhattai]|uniref:Uncharacterized protein n=1 Tax=Priestia aryabhattai TaxID=412384 RepID=A0ABD7X471_PRIAR|nr:hypothetical protein [Priestia aryabhattai]WEA47269.1 hypothetical protein PWO00_28540 [Priestia aryabhattai]